MLLHDVVRKERLSTPKTTFGHSQNSVSSIIKILVQAKVVFKAIVSLNPHNLLAAVRLVFVYNLLWVPSQKGEFLVYLH